MNSAPIHPGDNHGPHGAAPSLQQEDGTLGSATPLNAMIDTYPFKFSGTGSEYFRIWIVNLLLMIVTFGIYWSWAKVRRQKYFYGNTRIDDHAMDFHGEPSKIFRGVMLMGVLFAAYSQAGEIAPLAGLVALVALLALAPVLFRAAMRFRLANTSWHGMRFRFAGTDLKPLYWRLVPPMALIFLPGALMAFVKPDGDGGEAIEAMSKSVVTVIGLVYLVLVCCMPYFFWRIKRYQHNHYAWGPLQTEYRSGVWDTYKVFGTTLLVVLSISLGFGLALAALAPALLTGGGMKSLAGIYAIVPLFIAFMVAINIVPRAFFAAHMQNLIWSRTGNRYIRFKSDLNVLRFIGLQFKNYILILLTMGLYWPFAVIATKRMQIEAVALRSRISLDTLTDAARKRENDAAGDMAVDLAGDFLGLDIGM
jgi:uncharacterized membrane protein YjgN (DUF898 family)